MMDPTPKEQEALKLAMQFMGETIGEIGHQVPPIEWTPEQAMTIATAAVSGFHQAMVDD